MKNINVFNKINLEGTTEALKKRIDELLQMINEEVANCEIVHQELVDIIDELDSLEVYKAMMLDSLEIKYDEFIRLKEGLSKRKANKFFDHIGDLTEDINRLLKPNEVEEKAKAEIKRNTTKKNLNNRVNELKEELDKLNKKKAKSGLQGEELDRYHFLLELLEELNNLRI